MTVCSKRTIHDFVLRCATLALSPSGGWIRGGDVLEDGFRARGRPQDAQGNDEVLRRWLTIPWYNAQRVKFYESVSLKKGRSMDSAKKILVFFSF